MFNTISEPFSQPFYELFYVCRSESERKNVDSCGCALCQLNRGHYQNPIEMYPQSHYCQAFFGNPHAPFPCFLKLAGNSPEIALSPAIYPTVSRRKIHPISGRFSPSPMASTPGSLDRPTLTCPSVENCANSEPIVARHHGACFPSGKGSSAKPTKTT